MKKNLLAIVSILSVLLVTISSCKKDDDIITNPEPVEQELITRMTVKITGAGGFNQSFSYKVENGFGGTTPGTISIDSIKLGANMQYNVAVEVWNDKESPAEDITEEVKEENKEHLFVWVSNPMTGAGSVAFTNGSKDDDGAPLNLMGTLSTGNAGTGQLVVTLKHEPTDKNATTVASTGGETDAEAAFPVLIQ